MRLNETMWAAVYEGEIVKFNEDKGMLIHNMLYNNYKRAEYKIIKVRIIPVRGSKRGKS